MTARHLPRIAVIVITASLLFSMPAAAQTQDSKWEVEGHSGLSFLRRSKAGTSALPAAGAAITTDSPIFPSHHVPSWFFGDGAALFNDVTSEFGAGSQITPLDAVLTSLGFDFNSAAGFGARLRRTIRERLSLEVSLDALTGTPKHSDAFTSAVNDTTASFETGWTALFATGPFGGTAVTASATGDDGSSRELAVTGTVNYLLRTGGSFRPYLTAGGGILTQVGHLPSVTITGRYQTFNLLTPEPSPIDETDRVTLRYEQKPTLVAVVGGGVRRGMSGPWGIRLDGRVFIGQAKTQLLIDTDATIATGSPAGYIQSFTAPAIQFSNNSATGRVSTLGGPALNGFAAFSASGIETRVLLTIAVFRRF